MAFDQDQNWAIALAADRILVEARGAFTEACLAAHFDELARHVADQHERGCVRALVDLRGARVQPPAVIGLIHRRANELYRDGDRVALITPTSLLKVQLRRILPPDRFGIFVSPGAANHFLDRAGENAMAMGW
ncbi:hypothetical protein KY084_00860 [Stakelama sp. CBK3Z-3]|uniref:STAS domain-containing protein n=1 Tax=Stakelama flava TaxID=2860338 RepID=A0ABS6XHX6_9SPHN|nr:hypothetical protein [Stakelama flava]MBW4329428.1 hypothetical protein [Stakelama flava]